MRRSPFVLAATVAGLAGVLSFHTRKPTAVSAPSTGGSPTASAPAGGSSSGTASPATTAPSSAGGSSAGGSSPAGAATAGGVASATGPAVQYGYGVLAVKVTVRGKHILSVSVPQLQTAEPYSQSIAQQVIPYLQHQVLTAQNANISGITGATYTSLAYARSLQAALTKLGV